MPVRTDKRMGSPPRGRGKGLQEETNSFTNRITPAWAGKSSAGHPSQRVRRDHPRVGGEKDAFSSSKEIVQGSPPRGRGKVLLLIAGNPQKGITPAWAGKRWRFPEDIELAEDHPRVGGEKTTSTCLAGALQGSPPRGRGKDFSAQHPERGRGITPAWAGKSLCSSMIELHD